MDTAIEVKNLSKAYGKKTALDNVSINVERGTVFGVLGANGAGKSTMIECILGTKKKDYGSISIFGMNPETDRKKLFETVGVQFQDCAYQNLIRVSELCEITACVYKKPLPYKELLFKFGLSDKINMTVNKLSGGERQRLFIVLALIPDPQLVFLDELTTGLDTLARKEVWQHLIQLKEKGLTIILTSHFMDEVEKLCDKIVILRRGQNVFCGSIPVLLQKSGKARLENAYETFIKEEDN